jgi:hypothetical protein
VDRTCGAHGEEEKSMRNLKGKDSCKDLGVDEIKVTAIINIKDSDKSNEKMTYYKHDCLCVYVCCSCKD